MGTAESSVTAFFSKLADTWNTNDGAAFADFFTEDGSLTVSIHSASEPTAVLP
jgi:uncharacterized protein (TIGR02246 family)